MSIPSTLISGFIGLASCGSMRSLILNSLWLIAVDPHRGGSISLRPVQHTCCDIDPEYAHLWFHWTRLLCLHEFTALELIVAHRGSSKSTRTGAGPFHYDQLLVY